MQVLSCFALTGVVGQSAIDYMSKSVAVGQEPEKGADTATRNKYELTGLILAAQQGLLSDEDLANLAININETDEFYGGTALMWAAHEGHDAVVQKLLEKSADVETKVQPRKGKDKLTMKREYSGSTALMWAAERGHELSIYPLQVSKYFLRIHKLLY